MRALCILCLAAMLTGCGREPEVTETTIEVKKNGQVVHTIIEDFSESYYNLDELESTIQQACDTYNASAGKEAVVLKAAKENDDHTVTVVMQYADASAYSAFNKLALFVNRIRYTLRPCLLYKRKQEANPNPYKQQTFQPQFLLIESGQIYGRIRVMQKHVP